MKAPLKAKILSATPENLRTLGEALRSGELVAMPTETVYGLAGDALNPSTISKIFEAKERPTFDPLIVHVPLADKTLSALEARGLVDRSRLTPEASRSADALIRAFWPGPLTLVLPKLAKVPDLVTSGLSTVGIRMPSHSAAQALLAEARVPLAAPSANRFGRISPTSAQNVASELGDRIGWILDGGHCEIGLESTVAEITPEGHARILRPGGVTRDDITAKTGIPTHLAAHAGALTGPQISPGALSSHYAPSKPLHLLPGSVASLADSDWESVTETIRQTVRSSGNALIGLLLMRTDPGAAALFSKKTGINKNRIVLSSLGQNGNSEDGELRHIAHRLFSTMRELDESEAEILFAEPCPSQEGLGFAIADRLKRASFRPQA